VTHIRLTLGLDCGVIKGAVMILITWLLDIQLLVQSVPTCITTKVVSLNPVYLTWRGVLDATLCLLETYDRSVFFSGYSCFLHQ
jgi:hypothetical protein